MFANELKSEVGRYPLIGHIHVPKTAGSTLKKILRMCTPRGTEGADLIINDKAQLLSAARKSDWISGHVSRDSLASGLSWLNRPIEYYAAVRNPVDQLVSHLNFSIHRSHVDGYGDLHNDEEKALDAEVKETVFNEPQAAISFLLRHSDRYLNLQARLILGDDFYLIDKAEMISRISTYTYISNEFDLPKICRSFGFARTPARLSHIRENVALRYIEKSSFECAEMKDFFLHYHQYDAQLYEAVLSHSWPAEWRQPFRPALLGTEVFTYENFHEQTYLDSNPDVAAAVREGAVESGFAHFSEHGHRENRMKRRWFFAPPRPQRWLSATLRRGEAHAHM